MKYNNNKNREERYIVAEPVPEVRVLAPAAHPLLLTKNASG